MEQMTTTPSPSSQAMAGQRVWATPAATDAIVHLRAQLGSLGFHHVGGARGSAEPRLVCRPTQAGRREVCLGIVGGAEFYVDREQDAALGYPDFQIDVGPTTLVADEAGVHAEYRLVSRAVPGGGCAR
jgi:uncharacterized protein (DUF779 family)